MAPVVAVAELAFASWETIMWRSWSILTGTCSPQEYRRMTTEKAMAAWGTGVAILGAGTGVTLDHALAPWQRRAKANARRLRRRAAG
jgi:hypothetical protein